MSPVKKILFSLIAFFLAVGLFVGTIMLIDRLLDFLPDRDLRTGLAPSFTSQQSKVEFKRVPPPPDVKRVFYQRGEISEYYIPLEPRIYRHVYEPHVEARLEEEKLFYIDPAYGRINVRGGSARHQLFRHDEMIFDITYQLDEIGRRITPVENPHKRNRFLAFFGCSFVFGHGVEKDETLSYFAGKLFPNHFPVNYGIGGTGGHYVLSMLRRRNLHNEIRQKNGTGIYFYMDDHFGRIIGDTFWAALQPFAPYYYLDANEEVVYGETFEKERPVETYLQKVLFESNIRKKFNVKWPFEPRTKDYNLICKMMEKMKTEFLRQYPDGNFYIGFFPHSHRDFDRLAPCLTNLNVEFLDLRNATSGYEGLMHIEVDGHPNGRANYLVAHGLEQLLNHLK